MWYVVMNGCKVKLLYATKPPVSEGEILGKSMTYSGAMDIAARYADVEKGKAASK